MADLTLSACTDAAHVRLSQLGASLQEARTRQSQPDTLRLVDTILHLRLGLEDAARLPASSQEQAVVLAYLCETYGLRLALTDPLLRPLLPVVPAEGAAVRRRLLVVNGKILLVNSKALIMGASLAPSLSQNPDA